MTISLLSTYLHTEVKCKETFQWNWKEISNYKSSTNVMSGRQINRIFTLTWTTNEQRWTTCYQLKFIFLYIHIHLIIIWLCLLNMNEFELKLWTWNFWCKFFLFFFLFYFSWMFFFLLVSRHIEFEFYLLAQKKNWILVWYFW
jgi:hypothetical protein